MLTPSTPKVCCDLLLDRLFDLVDLLQPVHVLIHLPWIGSVVLQPRTLLTLEQQEIGILSGHNEGKSKADLIWVPKRVPHGIDVLSGWLHRASLLQHSGPSMLPLDVLREPIEQSRDRFESRLRPCKAPMIDIGPHGDPH